MTVYEQMTNTINSFTESASRSLVDGLLVFGIVGMIDGATYVRDNLTIEAAECIVY